MSKPIYEIWYTGTITGRCYIQAASLEAAMIKAKTSQDNINVVDFPDAWQIDSKMTKLANEYKEKKNE